MDNRFFIVYEGTIVKFEKQVNESMPLFIQKVEFLIHALDQGIFIEKARTLSNAYLNRLMYNVKYLEQIESELDKIIKIYKINP